MDSVKANSGCMMCGNAGHLTPVAHSAGDIDTPADPLFFTALYHHTYFKLCIVGRGLPVHF